MMKGMCMAKGVRAPAPTLIFTSPSHQYPLRKRASARGRRLALRGAWPASTTHGSLKMITTASSAIAGEPDTGDAGNGA